MRELPALDADMTPGDIADELQQLEFKHNEFAAIRLDADVRDFLVDALARHVTRR